MKKITVILLVLCMLFSFAACDSTNTNSTVEQTVEQTQQATPTPVPTPTPTPHDHDYATSKVTQKATCGKDGVETHTCACGATKTSAIKATGNHKWQDATCIKPKTCTVCGQTSGSTLSHTWKAATCTDPKTCKKCGVTEGYASGDHNWKDATCTAPKTCKICGETLGSELSHNWEYATCTKPDTCKKCGETRGEAKGHNYSEYDGKCSRCDKLDPEVQAKIDMCSLTLPSLPKIINDYDYRGNINSSVEVTNITYEIEYYNGNPAITVYFSGKKTYDSDGPGQSAYCYIGWKLYAPDGSVIRASTFSSPSIKVGETFSKKESQILYYYDKGDFGQYRLEILDTN